MGFISEQRLEQRLKDELVKGFTSFESETRLFSKAEKIINESIESQKIAFHDHKQFDIFLSHSIKDKKKIAGLKLEMEDMGFSVYVDWVEDKLLDRTKVNKQTALLLQQRMKNCRCLVYAFSENSGELKWMPWELGYFDGLKSRVAVLPITNKTGDTFIGTEYLGIYFYITIDKIDTTLNETLWVHESSSKYISFKGWLNENKNPKQH